MRATPAMVNGRPTTPAIASTSRVAGMSGSSRRPTTSRTRSGTTTGSVAPSP